MPPSQTVGFLAASCPETPCYCSITGSLQACPSVLPSLLLEVLSCRCPSTAQRENAQKQQTHQAAGQESPSQETHQAPLAACSPCCPTGFS